MISQARWSALSANTPRAVHRYQEARPLEVGYRITACKPITINQHHGFGWECLHVCIDDASRLAYTEILPDEGKESAVAFLKLALAWFARLGVASERITTDNGSCYHSQVFQQS